MSNKNIPSSSEDIALFIQQKAISHTNRKSNVDKLVKAIFFGLAFLSVLIVLATLVYLLYSGLLPFFKSFPLRETGEQAKLHFWKFISGTSFASPYFGIGWLIVNTIYMTLLSLVITIPTGILTALFITRVAPKFLGSIINTIITAIKNKTCIKFHSIFCGVQSGSYILDPYGDIYTCWETVGKTEYVLGKYTPSIEWNDRVKNWQGRNIGNTPKCSCCKYALLCGGGCLAKALKHKGNFKASYCDGYNDIFRLSANRAYNSAIKYGIINI